jgi:hypothetical protein
MACFRDFEALHFADFIIIIILLLLYFNIILLLFLQSYLFVKTSCYGSQ